MVNWKREREAKHEFGCGFFFKKGAPVSEEWVQAEGKEGQGIMRNGNFSKSFLAAPNMPFGIPPPSGLLLQVTPVIRIGTTLQSLAEGGQ